MGEWVFCGLMFGGFCLWWLNQWSERNIANHLGYEVTELFE